MSSRKKEAAWHNLSTGKADYGCTPPGEEFKKRGSLVRETVQNSLDAHDPRCSEPVLIDFEYLTLEGEDSLPNYSGYLQRVSERRADEKRVQNQRTLGDIEKCLEKKALEKAKGWQVLRIGDHHTLGLDYDEQSPNSGSWHKLVRALNSSSKTSQEGGSFGLGSGAHSVNSQIYMVFYGSRSLETKKYYFQGTAHLGAVADPDNPSQFCDPRVFFGKDEDGWTPDEHAPDGFRERDLNDYGTDVFIAEPRNTDSFIQNGGTFSYSLLRLVWQYVFNFAPAIKKGAVQAQFMQNGKTLTAVKNAEDAAQFLDEILALEQALELARNEKSRPEIFEDDKEQASAKFLSMFFRDQLQKVDVEIGGSKVGELFLREVKETDDAVVYAARKIGMRVASPWKRRIRESGSVAWLLFVEDGDLNKKLRELEAPDHLSWDYTRASDKSAAEALKKLRNEVAEKIKEVTNKCPEGDEVQIDLGALQITTANGNAVETDLKLRPVKFVPAETTSHPAGTEGSPGRKSGGKSDRKSGGKSGGKKGAKKPAEPGSHSKSSDDRIEIADWILAVDPAQGLYVLKFKPDSQTKMNIAFSFISDDESTNEEHLVSVAEVVSASGCSAEVSEKDGSVRVSGLQADQAVKLQVRIHEPQMSSLKAVYHG